MSFRTLPSVESARRKVGDFLRKQHFKGAFAFSLKFWFSWNISRGILRKMRQLSSILELNFFKAVNFSSGQ